MIKPFSAISKIIVHVFKLRVDGDVIILVITVLGAGASW